MNFIPLHIKIKVFQYIKHIEFLLSIYVNKLTISQIINPKTIPVIIINFNQLYYFRRLINFLQDQNFTKIVIIDNNSDYPPLLEYYESLQAHSNVVVERMDQNNGHRVFFENEELQDKYGKGYYVLTDPDINFYKGMPRDFMIKLIRLLNRNHLQITKAGFALNISDIPDHYNQKEKVLNWEKRFWKNKIGADVYLAPIDTTFALYLPGYPAKNNITGFYAAIRLGGKYSVKHGGWYHDSNNPTEEHKYYLNSANNSYSWKSDNNGNILSNLKGVY